MRAGGALREDHFPVSQRFCPSAGDHIRRTGGELNVFVLTDGQATRIPLALLAVHDVHNLVPSHVCAVVPENNPHRSGRRRCGGFERRNAEGACRPRSPFAICIGPNPPGSSWEIAACDLALAVDIITGGCDPAAEHAARRSNAFHHKFVLLCVGNRLPVEVPLQAALCVGVGHLVPIAG